MAVLFTSDNHWGHANVIRYCNRPFANVNEMDEEMIRRWNAVVQSHDLVYHLGDLSFLPPGPTCRILERLNGQKYWVFGNHDRRLRDSKEVLRHFVWARDMAEIQVQDPEPLEQPRRGRVDHQNIVLCHYAMKVWNRRHYGAWQLYGHSHGSMPDPRDSRQLDCGVDCWDYAPVTYQEIKAKMTLKRFKAVDRHGEEDR